MDCRLDGEGCASRPRCGLKDEPQHVEASAKVMDNVGVLAVRGDRLAEAGRLEAAGDRERGGRRHQGVDREATQHPERQRWQDAHRNAVAFEASLWFPPEESSAEYGPACGEQPHDEHVVAVSL